MREIERQRDAFAYRVGTQWARDPDKDPESFRPYDPNKSPDEMDGDEWMRWHQEQQKHKEAWDRLLNPDNYSDSGETEAGPEYDPMTPPPPQPSWAFPQGKYQTIDHTLFPYPGDHEPYEGTPPGLAEMIQRTHTDPATSLFARRPDGFYDAGLRGGYTMPNNHIENHPNRYEIRGLGLETPWKQWQDKPPVYNKEFVDWMEANAPGGPPASQRLGDTPAHLWLQEHGGSDEEGDLSYAWGRQPGNLGKPVTYPHPDATKLNQAPEMKDHPEDTWTDTDQQGLDNYKPWNPDTDQDPFDPRLMGANRRRRRYL